MPGVPGNACWYARKSSKPSGENFSASGGSTTITDPNGNVEIQRYVSGELVGRTRGAGTAAEATWSYEYDPDTLGRTKITDPNGHTTVNTYDPSGNLTSSVDPLGRTITRRTTRSTSRPRSPTLRATTTSTYDSGNLTSVSRPLSAGQAQTETLGYGDGSHPGDVTSVTDANGKTTTFAYDGAGDLVSVTDPLGNRRTSAFDAVGE